MNRFITLCSILLLYQSSLFAAQLNLPQTPLGMGNTLPPNVFFQLDDSGSMDWEVLPKTYWEACAYDPNITGGYDFFPICGTTWSADDGIRSYANGSFKNFNYIYDNRDNAYNSGCNNPFFQDNAIEACPIAGVRDWRIYSSGLNAVYYNPSVSYQPWLYNCNNSNTPCADASFFAARSYPVQGMPGYSQVRNLTGGRYDVWIDDKGYSGARPYRTFLLNVTNAPNGEPDVWDSHVTLEYTTGNSIRVYSTTYNPDAGGLNPTTVLRATLSGGACYNVLGSNEAVAEIFASGSGYTGTGGDSCRTIAESQQNFANWYEYSRRRAMAARGNIAVVINDHPNFRYGLNTINNRIFIEVPPDTTTDFTPYNDNILQQLFNYRWQALGTPNRSALNRVGQYFMGNLRGTRDPITESCQQNYTIFITDGFWNPESIPGYINDVDGDGISQTFADVARYYYQTDLSNLTNNVNPSAWDPATWQHMVTFTVSYGVSGNLVAGSNGWPNPPLTESSNWGNPFTNQPAKIDDLWHAAYNSKGAFFNALNPTDASEGLSAILGNVAQRAASAAPVAQDSSILSANSSIYQATFDTTNWTGDILAYTIDVNGTINPAPQWSAACMLNGGSCSNPAGSNPGITFNNRVIITRNWDGSNTGIAFRFPNNYTSYRSGNNYPSNLSAFLDDAPNNIRTRNNRRIQENQDYGEALLNYLRGDHTYEDQNSNRYEFRDRSSILGDIVNSAPAFIPPPYRNYPDNLENSAYSAFKSSYANRIPMLFFGGNDGMLHGLNATSGTEIFAYVPGDKYIYENLPGLSNRNFVHKFFVNAPPKEADVFINGQWRTIITGTLGSGGQTLYLLDITNPSLLSENRANQIYLWEFSDLVDDRMGFVMNAPIVAKVRTGANQSKWAIIVNNGYNSNQNDGDRSNGRPTLFILLIEDIIDSGFRLNQTYYRIEVGSNSNNDANGLSAPYAVDLDSDYVVDLVYAGDLHGNLWRFDLRSSNPANWSNNASILFTAQQNASRDQPITAAPIAGPHPEGLSKGVMVYFGTGKYLEPNDNSTRNQTTQAFYAIWDKMAGATVSKNALVQQQILGEVTIGSGATAQTYRAVSSNPVNWNVTPPPQNLGWYINLFVNGANSNAGERIVSQAILRNNNVIFTTLIPPSTPCDTGGNSWIMEVNAASGGSPSLTPFDVNNDGSFTIADYIRIGSGGNSVNVPAAGVKSTVGATGMPTIFMSPDRNSEIKVLSGSQGLGTIRENSGTAIGRQNWRQLY